MTKRFGEDICHLQPRHQESAQESEEKRERLILKNSVLDNTLPAPVQKRWMKGQDRNMSKICCFLHFLSSVQ